MNDIIAEYKYSVDEIEKMRSEGKDESSKLDNEIECINADYAASVDVLNAERKKKVSVLEKQKAQISFKGMEKIEEFEGVVDNVKRIVEVLTKPVIDIHRITEKEMKKACYSSKKVYYFDEMYDSNAISLRAVIVGRKNRVAAWRKKVQYSLYIIGHSETLTNYGREVHDAYKLSGIFFLTWEAKSNLHPINVVSCLKNSYDINELIEYYNENVKPLSGDNWRIETIKDVISKVESTHKEMLEIKEKYSFDDFKPVLEMVCRECGKDGLMIKLNNKRCRHCGAVLREMR